MKSGASSAVVLKAVREVREQDGDRKLRDWNRHTFLYTFHVSDELKQAAQSAYLESFGTDALSAHTFPSVKKFRSGVIDYAKSILSAGERAVGAFTTGGTESIILSMKCARDWARQHKPQVTHPQVICPVSAHPAFNKAAELLGFDVLRLPIGAGSRAVAAAVEYKRHHRQHAMREAAVQDFHRARSAGCSIRGARCYQQRQEVLRRRMRALRVRRQLQRVQQARGIA